MELQSFAYRTLSLPRHSNKRQPVFTRRIEHNTKRKNERGEEYDSDRQYSMVSVWRTDRRTCMGAGRMPVVCDHHRYSRRTAMLQVCKSRLFPFRKRGHIWDERIIDTHIKNLRKKLGTVDYIETIRGVGYRIDKEDKE